jgi:ABC-type polysaccharide/polyol phosphate export permease
MFATPTIYMQPAGELSTPLRAVLALNPVSGLIAAFRAACLGEPFPWVTFATATGCSVLLFLGGCLYFRRVEDDFADLI